MKIFTNRSKLKKVLIVILTVMLLTFSVPKPVHAAGGILLGPITALCTTLIDSVQHILERFMLGEWNTFMKDVGDKNSYNSNPGGAATVNLDEDGVKIGGAWWGDFTGTEIPVIQYTPEEIFSNRVPALDVNFIKPSVKTGDSDWDNDHNIAMKLQPVIASWYIAMRTMALVGLLSVLVYLGIRMLLTGVAADKAKYKKMLMDWLVAMCLLFALHYIMSFALTMSEVITSMITNQVTGSITVNFDGNTFTGNLMSYVRFMIQAEDTMTSLGFFLLYIMLMIYTIKFTWVYLKRVVNMAFLTLIAPLVAVTYPIDKVSDGKAQAFNLWIREFAFNALLQPLHLLLYIVLLGSATELVAINPLYAVVCLGFITAGEKLFKKMFGFDKASGGTLGSLAAAGLTGVANKAIMAMRKGPNGGGSGKVRTNDKYQRQGKDPGANKGYQAFDKPGNQGLNELPSGGDNDERSKTLSPEDAARLDNSDKEMWLPDSVNRDNNEETIPPEFTETDQENMDTYNNTMEDLDKEGKINSKEFEEAEKNYNKLKAKKDARTAYENKNSQPPAPQGNENVQQAMRNLGPEEKEEPEGLFGRNGMLWADGSRAKNFVLSTGKNAITSAGQMPKKVIKGFKKLGNVDTYKNLAHNANVGLGKGYKRFKAVAPTMALNTFKTAGRVGGAAVLGAVGVAAGATLTGDAEQSIGMGIAALGGSVLTGRALNSTVGRINNNRSTRDALGAAKYGSVTDYHNAKADKQHLSSQEHRDEYEKYFKDGKYAMSKAEFDKATLEYRQVGITDTKTIRKALHLEAQYAKTNKDKKEVRGKVQNIAQSYDAIDRKAVYGSDKNATQATLKNIENQIASGDTKQKRAIANEILQGYRDWYNIS